MPKMTDQELLGVVDAEFASAMGIAGGEISTERARAWKYYLSEPIGNEVNGQSQVVTSDVAEVVDGIMPSLLRLFTTADNLVSFDPVGPEDEEVAAQESDYVNYIFFKRNDAFMILYTWFFDALVQKNGIVKAWYETTEKTTTESYTGLTQEELFSLLSDEDVKPIERSEDVDDNGQVLHDIVVQRTCDEGRFVVENVPPDEYRISGDSRGLNPSQARMVGQEREVRRADLLSMGFDRAIVEKLPSVGAKNRSSEQLARNNKTDENSVDTAEFWNQMVLVRDAYILVDYEGTGRLERRKVMTAGNEVLENEPADSQPFHIISAKPLPHKHFGSCPAEAVMDVQEVSTTLLRQTLDNLYHSNNPGHAIAERGIGDNTLDDLLTRRVGGITRFAGNPAEVYMPLTVPFTAGATFPMLEYFDKVKRDRTGVHADSDGLNPDALKNVQQSVMGQAFDISRLKIEAIARIFAETGIKSLFLHLHELILKHQDKKSVVKLRNQWVEVDPTSWRDRFDMTVNIGLGIGSRDQNRLTLESIKQIQSELVAGGGMNLLVTPKNLYNTAAEFVKNAHLKDPSKYFTDPGDQKAPPPSDQQQQMQKQQQDLMQYQQQLDAKAQQLKEQQIMLDHQVELAKLKEAQEKREDALMVAMQGLKNDLLEIHAKYGAAAGG